MMNDERDRRDEPVDGSTGDEPTTQAWPAEPGSDQVPATDASTPDAGEPTAEWGDAAPEPAAARDEFETAPSGVEGWPRSDASTPAESDAPPPTAPEAWPPADARREAWPTDPPAAGSGDADTWPTRAPERGDEPAWASTDDEGPPASAEAAPFADAGAPDLGERTYDDEPVTEHPPSEAEAYAPPAAEPGAADGLDDTATMAAAGTAAPAHAVPAAGEVGESTQCPRCGTENRPGLAFCRNCGQRLVAAGVAATVERPGTPEGTMACPRCGTHNRAGVAFCQNCGANLRTAAAPGYVPPAAVATADDAPATVVVEERTRAVLGPIVLLIGAAGIVAGWLLPFPYGNGGSLFDRAFGAGGYGAGFWSGYPDVAGGLADQAYFGFAAPAPILAALLVILAIAGMARGRPGALQSIGLAVALVWSIGLAVLFVVVEVLGNAGGPLTELLRELTPGGIIFFLASLIVMIGTLTRFARS